MLERLPIATEQEEFDSYKLAFILDIQRVNTGYSYWDKVKDIQPKKKKVLPSTPFTPLLRVP
jgi:hypothetical protein